MDEISETTQFSRAWAGGDQGALELADTARLSVLRRIAGHLMLNERFWVNPAGHRPGARGVYLKPIDITNVWIGQHCAPVFRAGVGTDGAAHPDRQGAAGGLPRNGAAKRCVNLDELPDDRWR